MSDNDDKKKDYPYHRRFVRHRVRLRIEVNADEDYDTWTENLSSGGVCFDIAGRIEDGQDVGVRIGLRDKQPSAPIHCRCRIVWGEQVDELYRHGGQFVSFKDDDLSRLKNYLLKY
jgi:hypothetical protein